MEIKIALAGNPNSGKTTLFNALTGSNQFVGNWPGVTVEKKEGKLKKHKDVTITDLPGIYSLSPYTTEEVVARNYLLDERPNVILNIVDGTNLERNLYLTTQLMELGIPMVVAINMMDLVNKEGDKIDSRALAKELGLKIVEISAMKGTGIEEAAQAALEAAQAGKGPAMHKFSDAVEKALGKIERAAAEVPANLARWASIKIFERDQDAAARFKAADVEAVIQDAEKAFDDDSEAIITNERYSYIAQIIKSCYRKNHPGKLSTSDKIDRVVTNRILGLPIFALVMFLVYYVSMVTVGSWATDWANDGLFGDGWHLFGIGSKKYAIDSEEYQDAAYVIDAFVGLDNYDLDGVLQAVDEVQVGSTADYTIIDEETLAPEEVTYTYNDLQDAIPVYQAYGGEEPEPADYGIFVPGVPVLVGNLLDKLNVQSWLSGLVLDGIVGGVGAVLGFVPQMLVLFLMLSILEECGYMARIAFVLDRVFRKFGLSGKSFIPILIGTGCGIPGIMASRTIENESDRRMTIMTTTFIPCGAKLPFIAMVSGAIFGGSALVSTSAYFLGMAAIIISGIILKKTKPFAGQVAPFVMELPPYHVPTAGSVLRLTWERGWSFIKKAGTIILLSTIAIWFLTYFGFTSDGFRMLSEEELDLSILARLGSVLAFILKPLGFGTWQATVASITGLVAKENIVGTMGIVYGTDGLASVYANLGASFTKVAGYSFLIFNLLCAPCFAAMGAIKREMNNTKWTWFAILYECGFAYLISLATYQIGSMIAGYGNIFGFIVGLATVAFLIYMMVRKPKEA